MTELEKWQQVNQCETQSQLADLISKFADSEGMIQGRERKFEARDPIAQEMGWNVFVFVGKLQ